MLPLQRAHQKPAHTHEQRSIQVLCVFELRILEMPTGTGAIEGCAMCESALGFDVMFVFVGEGGR